VAAFGERRCDRDGHGRLPDAPLAHGHHESASAAGELRNERTEARNGGRNEISRHDLDGGPLTPHKRPEGRNADEREGHQRKLRARQRRQTQWQPGERSAPSRVK